MQRGRNAGEYPAAQITRQPTQYECRQACTDHEAAHTADQTQNRGFGQHQAQALIGCEAQHPEQRKLWHALRHGQRKNGKHQERAGEQGHQGQYAEVDAVGLRQIGHALLAFTGLRCPNPGG